MPEARFVLKEPKSTDKTLVYLFYRYNTQVLKYSTGEKIHPKFWNPEKQRARDTARYAEASEFNQRLNNIETAVNNVYRRLINNETIVTKEILKKELNRELLKEELVEKQVDFITWLKEEIKIAGISQKPGSIQVYNALVNHLTKFSEIKRYKLSFEAIDFDFYNRFSDYLLNDCKLLTNTYGKQIKTLKTFLNIATEKGVNKNLIFKNKLFRAPDEQVEHIYLTSEELDKLYHMEFDKKKYLERVRDMFLIGCYTGLRFSDFTQLKSENLKQTKDGLQLNVKTIKTGQKVVIPINSRVKAIWKKYDGVMPRAISNQKMNDYLKELGEEAEINDVVTLTRTNGSNVVKRTGPKYEFISTHTARRSFATNTFLSGIATLSIMKLTGHKTESSFMKYIKVSQERNAELLSNHEFFK
jgi:site-specific recombinase XerD